MGGLKSLQPAALGPELTNRSQNREMDRGGVFPHYLMGAPFAPQTTKVHDMKHDVELISRHLRAAVLGEPMPTFRGDGLGEMLAAINRLSNPLQPVSQSNRDLSRVGLAALALLIDRLKASSVAERELSLMIGRKDL